MNDAKKMSILRTAHELAPQYDGWLCDVWGVVHNGVHAYEEAVDALQHYRAGGGLVCFITNAPRPASSVIPQLRDFGVPDDAYDSVITSGDVTRALLDSKPDTKVYHFGPQKDYPLLEGLKTPLTDLEQADVVLLTGPMEEEEETVEDYVPFLRDLLARGLPLFCANPDLVVQRGDHLVMCAGSIAQAYEQIGGEVVIAGKPHTPIYDAARAQLSALAGRKLGDDRLLAIGDGLPTDVKGAALQGLDVLFLTGGIYAAELDGPLDDARAVKLGAELVEKFPGICLAGINDELRWA